jgi:transposase-like protein
MSEKTEPTAGKMGRKKYGAPESTRFNPRQLKSMKQMYDEGYSVADICERFAINHQMLLDVAKEQGWEIRRSRRG